MTNELEKTFFDTFGIEPIGCNDNKKCTGVLDCTQCHNAKYPQTTDRILLGFSCIDFNENLYKCRGGQTSVDEVKERVLSDFIHEFENDLFLDKENIKQQVRTLFEEG